MHAGLINTFANAGLAGLSQGAFTLDVACLPDLGLGLLDLGLDL